VKDTRVVPESERWPMRAAPPAYVNVTSLNTHSPHSSPSNGWIVPEGSSSLPKTFPRKGGTTGSIPVFTTPLDCANVDVWLPESIRNSNTLQIPATNDPNATVTLDIHPPVTGQYADCSEWHYHYGNPPRL
jgi:hypothetical protein